MLPTTTGPGGGQGLANRVLAMRLGHPARILPTRSPLVSLLGVVGMAVSGGLIGYAAGFWEKRRGRYV